LLFFVASLIFPIPALADSQHLFSGGFGSALGLRWTSSLSSTYLSDYVIPAANGWNGISSKVTLTQVSSGTYQIKVNTSTTASFGTVGEMIQYCSFGSGAAVCQTETPWTSVQVLGYTNQIANFYLTKTEIISTVYAHEFGHALSMAHNTIDTPSLMETGSKKTILPQATDKSHLKLKWGN
jgi:hypothetical protein